MYACAPFVRFEVLGEAAIARVFMGLKPVSMSDISVVTSLSEGIG